MNKTKINIMLFIGIVVMATILFLISIRQKETEIKSIVVTNEEFGISIEGYVEEIKKIEVASYDKDSEEAQEIYNVLSLKSDITDMQAYDINTTDETGNPVSLAEKVKLIIDIPSRMQDAEGDSYSIYVQNEDGTYASLTGYQNKNTFCVNINRMGRYILIKSSEEVAGQDVDNNDLSIEELDETQYAMTVVNVRSGPDTTYEILGTLGTGDECHVTGKTIDGEWYRVSYQEATAYVIASSLSETQPQQTNVTRQSTSTQTPTQPDTTQPATPETDVQQPAQPETDVNQPETGIDGTTDGQVEGE